MFSSNFYQKSIFYSFLFIIYNWLFLIFQPSIIASISAIYYPKLIIISLFVPFLLVSILFSVCSYLLPKKISSYFLAFIPSGLLTYLIYIFLDKLYYSKFSENSLDLTNIYKILFMLALLALFFILYFFNIKKKDNNTTKLKKIITQISVISIFISSIIIFFYYVINGKVYDLKVETNSNFHPVNILIISIDGAENDLMPVYGYKENTTPFLKKIKNEFLIADNFYTNNCCTFGSIVSLYTGKSPIETKVIYPGSHLIKKDRYEHLPGILSKLGYNTIQLTIPFYGDALYMGVVRGFKQINYHNESVLSNIMAFLYEFFLYEKLFLETQIFSADFKPRVNFFLRNIPYTNPYREVKIEAEVTTSSSKTEVKKKDPFSDSSKTDYIVNLIKNSNNKIPFFIHLHLMATHTVKPEEYKKGMIESDLHIKDIYYGLKNSNLIDNTLLVITSDHNQGWVTTKPIPLLIRFPHLNFSGIHYYKNTQIIDLAPTILNYIGVKKPYFMKGESILNNNLIKEDRPIVSINSIYTTHDGILDSNKNSGISETKIQICNQYILENFDKNGKKIQTPIHNGYETILPCKTLSSANITQALLNTSTTNKN